jgi:hypothetical protein
MSWKAWLIALSLCLAGVSLAQAEVIKGVVFMRPAN